MPTRQLAEEVALLRASRQAMATTFEVVLPCGLPFALEASRGDFALALALGFLLLLLAFGVNALLGLASQSRAELA